MKDTVVSVLKYIVSMFIAEYPDRKSMFYLYTYGIQPTVKTVGFLPSSVVILGYEDYILRCMPASTGYSIRIR